jgi:hypothetical protein
MRATTQPLHPLTPFPPDEPWPALTADWRKPIRILDGARVLVVLLACVVMWYLYLIYRDLERATKASRNLAAHGAHLEHFRTRTILQPAPASPASPSSSTGGNTPGQ